MKVKIMYTFDKETKGAVRYAPYEPDTGFGVIYIRKEVIKKPYPKNLNVTIEEE